jgi:hypothetical protein
MQRFTPKNLEVRFFVSFEKKNLFGYFKTFFLIDTICIHIHDEVRYFYFVPKLHRQYLKCNFELQNEFNLLNRFKIVPDCDILLREENLLALHDFKQNWVGFEGIMEKWRILLLIFI